VAARGGAAGRGVEADGTALSSPLDHFLDEFPSVIREHAVAVLEFAKRP
jgi:hypothetical protein